MRTCLAVVVTSALCSLLSFGGCSCEPPPPLTFVDGCSPLLHDVDCGVPYPNDYFLVDDAATPTGKRIEFRGPAKMLTFNVPVNSADLNETFTADGFSRNTPIVWAHGVRVDPESITKLFDDPAATTSASSTTLLIEAATGRLVPHFVDTDPRALVDERAAVIMRPLEQLQERTRYVVAVHGLTSSGAPIAPSEQFKRLRDKTTGDDDAVLTPLLARFESDVFAVTDAAGVARADLQLAWDFTTGSDENTMRDMLDSRAIALAELDRTPPVVAVEAIFEGANLDLILDGAPETWRMINGTITGPRIVDSNIAGARLALDDNGRVRLDGTTTFEFTALVPASVRDRFAGGAPLLFGHGFFGSRQEVEGTATRLIADHSAAVMIAIDWQGMTADDSGEVVAGVGGRVSESLLFGERVMQGMVNYSTLTRAMKLGLFDALPEFQRPTVDGEPGVVVAGADSNAGDPVMDIARPIAFLGISQGHVLGGTLSAHNANIERNIMMVGGANFSVMMFRAVPFKRFLALLDISMPDPLDQQKLHAHMQSQFDRFDPITFAPYVIGGPLPDTATHASPDNGASSRQVLEMMGIGDSQVPNIGSALHARVMGIPLLEPSPVSPLIGASTKTFPAESGFVAYDLGVSADFNAVAEPAEDENPVHEGLRRVPEAMDQMATFINEGVIENFCDGACVVPLP